MINRGERFTYIVRDFMHTGYVPSKEITISTGDSLEGAVGVIVSLTSELIIALN